MSQQRAPSGRARLPAVAKSTAGRGTRKDNKENDNGASAYFCIENGLTAL